MLEPLALVLALRTSHLVSVDECSFPRHATRFFGLIMGIIKVCLCLICSQNKTLQTLLLDGNPIGAEGAAALKRALTVHPFTSLAGFNLLSLCDCFSLRNDSR